MPEPLVQLRPLTRSDLPTVGPWFEDQDTRRFLGGPDWPIRMLDLADQVVGTEFRGATQLGAFRYLATANDYPVGQIDCGVFHRWVEYLGTGHDGPIYGASLERPTGSIAYVVDPKLRNRGWARAMITELMNRRELEVVRIFEAGVEPENVASIRCLFAAGFALENTDPDFENMLYLTFRR
jgi:RimJ/RimL family protein N-acetyltransferase